MADKKISQLTAATTPLDGTEVLPIVQSGSTVKVANNDLRPKQIQSNATSGVLQIVGPAAAATRVMTVPDANFTAARTDAAQSFTGVQTFNNGFVAGGPGISPAGKFTCTGGNTQITLEDATNSKLGYLFQSNDVLYYYNNALTKQVQVDADFKFFAGNFVPSTAAKGINFTANTPAAGMTSQLLNWYEEGTFTPTFDNTGGVTYNDQLGWFTRIGNTVHVTIYIRTTALTTNANDVTIGGLPYGMSSSGGYYPVGSVFPERGFNSANATEGYQCIGIQGTSTIKIYGVKSGTGANTTNVIYTDLQAGDNRVRVNLTYRV